MSDIALTLSLVDMVTAPAKKAQGAFAGLSDQAKKLSADMGGFTDSAKSAGDGASGASGEMGAMGGAFEGVAAGAAAAAAAVGVAVIALGALTLKGAELALEMGELREKTLATFSALAGGDAAGAKTLTMLDGMRAKLGMTRAELAPMAEKLMAMGYQGAELQKQLTALATVKAVGVDGGTEEYTAILKKMSAQSKVSTKDLTNLYKTGVSEAEIAAKMGISMKQLQTGLKAGTISAQAFSGALTGAVTSKGAGALAAQANSLTAQLANFKETLAQLFEGVDAKPMLDALKDLFGAFGQGTASGQTMKAAITGTFKTIFQWAAKVIPYIKTGFELLIIGALKLYIWLKPIVAWLKNMWQQAGGMATLWTVLKGIGVVLALVAAPIVLVVAQFVLLGAAIVAVGVGLAWLIGKIAGFAVTAVSALADWAKSGASIAGDFISGLISGIGSGAATVIAAVKGLGDSMLAGVKGALGIHSPSVEMAKLGVHTTTGFAQGITSAQGQVDTASASVAQTATKAMAAQPAPAPAAAAAPAGGGKGGGGGGTKIEVNINVDGGGGGGGDKAAAAKEMADLIAEQVSLVFEQIAMSQGMGMNA